MTVVTVVQHTSLGVNKRSLPHPCRTPAPATAHVPPEHQSTTCCPTVHHHQTIIAYSGPSLIGLVSAPPTGTHTHITNLNPGNDSAIDQASVSSTNPAADAQPRPAPENGEIEREYPWYESDIQCCTDGMGKGGNIGVFFPSSPCATTAPTDFALRRQSPVILTRKPIM